MTLKKRVLVSGNFNVVHPGHLRLLKFAKECGDLLIVAVNSDFVAGGAALVSEDLRLESINSIGIVDECLILKEPIESLIARIKPDVVVKGKEYEGKHNPEKGILDSYNAKLLFSSGEAVFTSLDLLRQELLQPNEYPITLPTKYMDRHQINASQLLETVDSFSKLKICVIGDLIVDEYINCDALGMSQEDPSLVVSPQSTNRYIGGAGIVAAHAAQLGAVTTLLSVTGVDEVADFAYQTLIDYSVNVFFAKDETRPTTLKKRYRAKGKTLLRVSHLHQENISSDLQDVLFYEFTSLIDNFDLLVFSDFNYGCLPQTLVDRINQAIGGKGMLRVADSQSSSQIGDVGRFVGMNLLMPTEREARISTRNYSDGLAVLVSKLMESSKSENIILKLGEDGALICKGDHTSNLWSTDRIDALNIAPKDTAGAGDSMLIASSLAMASGSDIWAAACLGSLVAGIQVGRIGNLPISAGLIKRVITQ